MDSTTAAQDTGAYRPSVLVLSHLYPSDAAPGRGPFIEAQCRELARLCDLTVVTGRWDLTSPVQATRGGLRVISVPLSAPARLPSALRVAVAVPAYARATLVELEAIFPRPEIIHAHFALPDGVAAVRAGARAGVPVVVSLLGSDFYRQLARPVFGALAVRELARADAIIGVGRRLAEGFAARVPAAAGKVEHIPLAYDAGLVTYEPKPPNGPFLFVGSLSPVKQPLMLLEAFAKAAGRCERDLVMIGDGPLRPDVERTIAERGLVDRVRLLARVPELQPYYREAVALVVSSRSEGGPTVAFESLATGTPVVGTRVGAIPDLVVPGRSGLIVEPGDVDRLAQALVNAASIPWDFEAIAREAPIIDWAENARRVTAVYRRVLGR